MSSERGREIFIYARHESIPAGATITGLKLRLDAKVDSTTGAPQACPP